jgi:hypothetical protein
MLLLPDNERLVALNTVNADDKSVLDYVREKHKDITLDFLLNIKTSNASEQSVPSSQEILTNRYALFSKAPSLPLDDIPTTLPSSKPD